MFQIDEEDEDHQLLVIERPVFWLSAGIVALIITICGLMVYTLRTLCIFMVAKLPGHKR